MVFSSLLFLTLFLPLFLTVYYIAPPRSRNDVALLGSYVFYAWGAPRFVIVLLVSSAIDYALSRLIDRTPVENALRRRMLLIVSLVLNLVLLALFKYADFLVGEFNALLALLGEPSVVWAEIALPIGISFFTFQKITYVVDVYRRVVPPARVFGDYALYVAMFPQLIAGPIVRYHDISDQLSGRVYSWEKVYSGIWRFCLGLAKKALVANALAAVADRAFAAQPAALPAAAAWLGVFCFTFQIYFDFSGYSDMAIGLGRMMGFELLENFNCPYVAASFTEFWRRWHISLSNFMREYLYIPLGGNRVSQLRMYANLWIVFLLSGLWHGANWTFVAWGAYHGLFLSLEKMFSRWKLPRPPRLLAIPLTFLLITVGWALFRCALNDVPITNAVAYLGRMADVGSMTHAPEDAAWLFRKDIGIGWILPEDDDMSLEILADNRQTVILLIAAVLSFLPAWPVVHRLVQQKDWLHDRPPVIWAKYAIAQLLLVLSICSLANLHFNPFLYFRF